MAKFIEKEKAIQLRKHGMGIKQIAKQLQVSPSTVSVWCREVRLSQAAIEKISHTGNTTATKALLAYSQRKLEQREQKTMQNRLIGEKIIGTVSKRDLLFLGIGLYWGEGYKNGNREFGFTNSDPAMILMYIKWLQSVFDIALADLTLRVSINDQHRKRIDVVQHYWSELTDIPLQQFTKPSLIATQSKKVYANKSEHFGTLRVKVKCGSDYREQVLGAIDSLKIN